MASTSTSAPPAKAAYRTHAKRSCLVCRQRKTRCELPDTEVQASPTPLPVELSCHRCKTLRLECIVADAPRGAATAAKRKRKEKVESPSSSNGAVAQSPVEPASRSEDGSKSTLIHFFKPDGSGSNQSFVMDGESGTVRDDNRQAEIDRQVVVHPYPMSLLKELLVRSKSFGTGLGVGDSTYPLPRIISSFAGRIGDMQSKLKVMLLFLPHLPTLTTLLSELDTRPSPSVRLLLCSVLLLTIPDSISNKLDLQASLRKTIQQELIVVLMTESSNIRSVQALELIAVYTPVTSIGNLPVSGASCLASARSTALAMGLHRSIDQLKQVQAASLMAGFGGRPSDPDAEKSAKALSERAIIWSSLKTWDAHFRTFEFGHNSPVHPHGQTASDPELESSMVVAFTQASEDQDEVGARSSGCAAIKHRLRCLQAVCAGKPDLNQAGEIPEGQPRATELAAILDRSYSILENHRQARERESAVLSHSDYYVRSIGTWCELEAVAAESVLTCAALSVLLKECFGVMSQGASAFFERTHRMGISQFMAQYGGRNRIDETDQVLSVFMSLPSSRFAAPARSTCAMVVVCAMHIMESCASSIAGFKRPHPRLASLMSRLEGLAEKLKAIDSTGTVEQGSIPQATSSMVSLIIDHIRIWQHRLLESQAAISSSQQPEASEANQSVRHEMENAVMPVSSRLPAQAPSGPPSFDPASSYRTSGFNSSPSATGQPRSFNSSYMPTFGPQGFQAQNGDLLPPTIGGPAISDAEIDSILMNGGVMFWPNLDLDMFPNPQN